MVKIKVEAGKPYEVIIGNGVLKDAPHYIAEVTSSKKAAVITDDNVDAIYGESFMKSLRDAGFDAVKYVFPHGEANKNADNFIAILNFLAENRLTRSDTVIALGGGVVGDISGFAAASYLRGIKYIQVPTTLLSAVDSSVGGKCAIDLDAGKNLAGAFHQPSLVLCDPDTLDTLPPEVLADGCGEVIKYGILSTPELLGHLFEMGESFDREYVISTCVKLKADIVAEDEFDCGNRAFLNLGHTTGHAIEKLSAFRVSHGSAVATGCAIAARASAAAGLCTNETVSRVESAVEALGHSIKTPYTSDELCDIMLSDKKRRGDIVEFIAIRDIGDCSIEKINVSALAEFVSRGL